MPEDSLGFYKLLDIRGYDITNSVIFRNYENSKELEVISDIPISGKLIFI